MESGENGRGRLDPRPLGIVRAHGSLAAGPVQDFHRDLRSRAASIPDVGHYRVLLRRSRLKEHPAAGPGHSP